MDGAQNIYDDPDFFAGYTQLARQQAGLESAREWSTLRSMLPQLVTDLNVVDLGCGFGWFSRWAAEHGARQVLGIDLSERMLERARVMTDSPTISYQRADLDQLVLAGDSYDLAFSSLALHYLQDLDTFLHTVHGAMRAGGQLVFSVEHPILSASPTQQFEQVDDDRRVWAIENYLIEGRRTTSWFADGVIKYHRTMAGYVNAVINAGFVIDELVEFGQTENPDDAHRPWFLLVGATKKP